MDVGDVLNWELNRKWYAIARGHQTCEYSNCRISTTLPSNTTAKSQPIVSNIVPWQNSLSESLWSQRSLNQLKLNITLQYVAVTYLT